MVAHSEMVRRPDLRCAIGSGNLEILRVHAKPSSLRRRNDVSADATSSRWPAASARSAASAPECRSRNWCPLSASRRCRGRTRAGRDGIADGVAADTEAGADDRAGSARPSADLPDSSMRRWSLPSASGGEQALHHVPVAGVARGPDEQAGLDAVAAKGRRAIDAAAEILVFGEVGRGRSDCSQDCHPARSALSANR